ncbi:MAG: hypothetical protein LBD48_10670 [Treponema sp.]|jgi:hypothetical protein|nr:hypothetical protein [Treponema sp.]
MKSKPYLPLILYSVFAVSGSLYATGEKTISLEGPAWNSAELKDGIAEAGLVRSRPVLVLASSGSARIAGSSGADKPLFQDSALDLSLSFDEARPGMFTDSAGNYRITASPAIEPVERRYARAGFGAALFRGPGTAVRDSRSTGEKPLVIEARSNTQALFAPDSHIRDFSLEFWLYPLNMENGEHILSWVSSSPVQTAVSRNAKGGKTAGSDYTFQRIQCESSKNRLRWSFLDFFTSPDGSKHININITGNSPVVPKTWSHHLIRFDSMTGIVEYLVNGKTEAIEYASSTGHEGGEVYNPIVGTGGSFTLGAGFTGMLDEFRIYSAWVSSPMIQKYPGQGGKLITRAMDLGEGNSSVSKVEALGGRTSTRGGRIDSDFRENGRFRFSDDSELQFFIRAADNPYQWEDSDWLTFTPGADLAGAVQGRYIQIAVDFYPSADGESSPYLEELRVTYRANEPPLPPSALTAVAFDGGVQLRWKNSPDVDTAGYLIYYGESADEYFGVDAVQGTSPIDAGKRNSIFIEGLKNGTLYYFRAAAYDRRNPGKAPSFHAGEFSREVRARPLRGLSAVSVRAPE